jgi:hypothetical protein
MTKDYCSAVLLSLFCLVFKAHAEEPASVYIYLFESDKPLPQVEIIVDGGMRGKSDSDGSASMKLEPGQHHFSFRQNATEILDLDLPLTEGENIQLIITTFGQGQDSIIDIESSNSAAGQRLLEMEKKPEALGKGVLEGEVVSVETKKPVSGAQVFVSGVSSEIKTGPQGKFKLEVPVGEYSISILHSDFSTQIKDKVPVLAGSPPQPRLFRSLPKDSNCRNIWCLSLISPAVWPRLSRSNGRHPLSVISWVPNKSPGVATPMPPVRCDAPPACLWWAASLYSSAAWANVIRARC